MTPAGSSLSRAEPSHDQRTVPPPPLRRAQPKSPQQRAPQSKRGPWVQAQPPPTAGRRRTETLASAGPLELSHQRQPDSAACLIKHRYATSSHSRSSTRATPRPKPQIPSPVRPGRGLCEPSPPSPLPPPSAPEAPCWSYSPGRWPVSPVSRDSPADIVSRLNLHNTSPGTSCFGVLFTSAYPPS